MYFALQSWVEREAVNYDLLKESETSITFLFFSY